MLRHAAAALALVAGAGCASGPPAPTEGPVPSAVDGVRWVDAADMPTPRTEVAVAAIGDVVYAAGGFTRDGSPTDVVEALDTTTGRWTTAAALPEPLHHTGLAALGGRLYVVGGYTAGGAPTDAVWSIDPTSAAGWREEPDLPTARGALAVAVAGEAIHAVGGASSFGGRARLVSAHEALDPAGGDWTTLPDLPDARDHLAAAGFGGKLYVAGGRYLSLSANQARLDVYDAAAGSWSRGPDMPTARGGLAAAALAEGEGRIVVVGGEEPEATFAEAEAFDIATGEWLRLPDLGLGRHGLGAATLGADRLYVVGGGPRPGLTVSGATEYLTTRG